MNRSRSLTPAEQIARIDEMRADARAAVVRTRPTADELIINAVIFKGCNHERWSAEDDDGWCATLTCHQCGETASYDVVELGDPEQSRGDVMACAVRAYSAEPVLAALIIRTVEQAGWRSSIAKTPSGYTCRFEAGRVRFQSDPSPTRETSVCQAAARLAASGEYKG